MADADAVYRQYMQKFGYPPKQPNHLTAFAKQQGIKLTFCAARSVISQHRSENNNAASSLNASQAKSISITVKTKKANHSASRGFHTQSDAKTNISPVTRPPAHQSQYVGGNDNKQDALEEARRDAMARLAASNHSFAQKAKQYNLSKDAPKIPPQPTVIITHRNKRAEPPKPPKRTSPASVKAADTIIDDNDDEKEIDKSKQAIFCRVNYECKSEQAKQEIYAALKKFVQFQLSAPHPGTITYHFTCPDPVKQPLKLEFIELYLNEQVYWQHSKSQAFGNAFLKAFAGDKNMTTKTFVTIGENLSKLVKLTNQNFGSAFAATDAGYLLHPNYLKALDYVDATKLMLKFHIIVPKYYKGKKKNVDFVLDVMRRLSVYAQQSYAVMFHAHRLDVKCYPDHLELISTWPNVQCLLEFLQNEKVQSIIIEFKQFMLMESEQGCQQQQRPFLCEVYSEKPMDEQVAQTIAAAFEDIGHTQQIVTDIGYILHPKANSSQLT